MKHVEVEAFYAHYKHPERNYEVVELAILEATEEVAVVYRALYGEKLTFIRPFANWLETVEVGEGKRVPRFSRV